MSDSRDMSHVDPRFLTTTSAQSSIASANLTYGSGSSSAEPGTVYGSESDLAFDDSTHRNGQSAAHGQFYLQEALQGQQQAQQHNQQLDDEVPNSLPGYSTANAFGPIAPGLPLGPSWNQDFGHRLDPIPQDVSHWWAAAAGGNHVEYCRDTDWSTPSAPMDAFNRRSDRTIGRH